MATQLTISNGANRSARVKIRHPLAPIGLGIITLGIYTLYWYYELNRELRDAGEDVSPGISLLAVTLGIFLVVPPFVSIFNTADRIRRAQDRASVNSPIAPWLAVVLLFIPIASFFQTAYMQSHLNRAWERLGGVTSPAPAPAAAPTGPPTGPAGPAQ